MDPIARSNSNVLCVGHRGAAGYQPENSLISIQTALDMGAEWIEIDVHILGDELIVFHDTRLERLTGQLGLFADLNPDDLAGLTSLGEPIPTLREVVALIDRKAGLVVEIKAKHCQNAMALLYKEMLGMGWESKSIIVSSFDHIQLFDLKKSCPDIQIGVLIHCIPLDLATLAIKLEAYSLHCSKDFLSEELVADAQNKGLKVFCYTVNFEDEMQTLMDMGVDGIMTDYPDRFLQMR